MVGLLISLFVLLFPPIFSQAQANQEKSFSLSYASHHEQTFSLTSTFSWNQTINGYPIQWKGNQEALFTLTLFGEKDPLSIHSFPFILKMCLNSLKGTIDKENTKETFSLPLEKMSPSTSTEETPFLVQLNQCLKKPFFIRMEKDDFTSSKELESFLPLAQKTPIKELLKELFEPIFGLIEQEIKQGAVFKREPKLAETTFFPPILTYEIQNVTKEEIMANYQGLIPTKTRTISNPQDKDKPMQLSFSGELKGAIRWKTNNALFCAFSTHYLGKGTLMYENLSSPLQFEAIIHVIPK